MPTYDYECSKCGHAFEQFQRMSDEPLKRCPKCKGKVKRLVGTGSGIIFKGTGFYETDYKTKTGTPPSSPAADKAKTDKPAAAPAATPSPAPAAKKDGKS